MPSSLCCVTMLIPSCLSSLIKARTSYSLIFNLSEFTSHNKNVDFAGRVVYDENGVEVINFGKYKGQPVAEVLNKDMGYYGWIMKSEFPLHTKKVFTEIKLKNFNK